MEELKNYLCDDVIGIIDSYYNPVDEYWQRRYNKVIKKINENERKAVRRSKKCRICSYVNWIKYLWFELEDTKYKDLFNHMYLTRANLYGIKNTRIACGKSPYLSHWYPGWNNGKYCKGVYGAI